MVLEDDDEEAARIMHHGTGILHDREAPKMAIAELKGLALQMRSILIVSDAKYAQEETLGRAISEEQLASLPDLSSGRVLTMVEAEERAEDALDILKRHHVVTAGVRIPTP